MAVELGSKWSRVMETVCRFRGRAYGSGPLSLRPDTPRCGTGNDREVCVHRGWSLLAAHVRSNHVHAVVEAEVPPERVMGDFKAYARRRLNSMSRDVPNRKRWARHGSTRWLWQPHVSAAMQYAMSMFEPHQLCAIAIPAALSATASGDERAARAQLENPSAR